MKTLLLFLTFFQAGIFLHAQEVNPKYDAELAQKLGADDYGMKSYVLVVLKTGSNQTKDKAFVDSCFKGHMNNIKNLAALRKLVVAGPLKKNENSYRGIFILNVTTFEEAKELMKKDAAIESGILEAEMYHWYGSAALPLYLDAAEKVGKLSY